VKTQNFSRYVHEYTDNNGHPRFAVAEWDDQNGQYICPLDARSRKVTGCSAEFARKLADLGGYPTKRQALRRARYIFGVDES
jgi:hypothetical protein